MSDKVTIKSIEDLKRWVEIWVKTFNKKQIVSLVGPMGVGKTKTVELVVQALGGAYVSSPTFAIHRSYQTSQGVVDHLDLYRLKNEADLESTGFWDLFSADQGLVLIEWGDRLEGDWTPPGWSHITLELQLVNPQTRQLRVY